MFDKDYKQIYPYYSLFMAYVPNLFSVESTNFNQNQSADACGRSEATGAGACDTSMSLEAGLEAGHGSFDGSHLTIRHIFFRGVAKKHQAEFLSMGYTWIYW